MLHNRPSISVEPTATGGGGCHGNGRKTLTPPHRQQLAGNRSASELPRPTSTVQGVKAQDGAAGGSHLTGPVRESPL